MGGKLQFEVYELDRDALELRKHGVPVRLQEQPLRVLATLVERPGEIAPVKSCKSGSVRPAAK